MMDCSTFSQYAVLPEMSVVKETLYHMICSPISQYGVIPVMSVIKIAIYTKGATIHHVR
jgi:Zn-dependent alcohol dehydrogenase